MGLIFQRLARSHAKNGYFPTDEMTAEAAFSTLFIDGHTEGVVNVLDPCCGEGAVLGECASYLRGLGNVAVRSYGVEYDRDRAYAAKSQSLCLHGDLHDTIIQPRAFSLLWLNPPYGQVVADSTASQKDTVNRLEKQFYQRSFGALCFDGIMVLIVPHYVLDKQFSRWLCHHFTDITCWKASVDTYKQVVLIGRRVRYQAIADKHTMTLLRSIGAGECVPLPIDQCGAEYRVPVLDCSIGESIRFELMTPEPEQLSCLVAEYRGLWPDFDRVLRPQYRALKPPLCRLSNWHLALMLASGAFSGLVSDKEGRTWLVKGQTHKTMNTTTRTDLNDDGDVIEETRVSTEQFVPKIIGIDFTESTLGHIITIK